MDSRLISYFIVLVLAFVYSNIEKRYGGFNARKNYIILICVLLGLQSGLRGWGIGPDTYGYFLWFEEIKYESWDSIFQRFPEAYLYGMDKDPGFRLFVKTIQFLVSEYQLFLVIAAIPFFTALGVFLYKNTYYTRDAVFAFVLYISLFQIIALSGIRQQIAMAIALFAYNYIEKRKFIKFIFLVILGSTIHISILVIIPMYFLAKLSNDKIRLLYYAPLIMIYFIITNAQQIVAFMAGLLVNEYYLIYAQTANSGGGIIYTAIAITVAIFGVFHMRKTLQYYPQSKTYIVAMALMIFYAPLVLIDGALIRVGQYFSVYMMVFIPFIINTSYNQRSRITIFSVMIIFLILLSIRKPFDYNFFWQNVPIPGRYLR